MENIPPGLACGRSRLGTSHARVVAVHRSPTHSFHKLSCERITLITGQGVAGDAHCGVTVKHRSRVRQNPHQPNLRQIHLIHHELYQTLNTQGFGLNLGELGENISTQGIDLLGLPRHTRLTIGNTVIEVTGLRNPCQQLNDFKPGLMNAVLDTDAQGNLIRKAGIMGIVIQGGIIRKVDRISVHLPSLPHLPLERV